MSTIESVAALPRRDLYRACFPAVEMRGEFDTETPPMLTGHFSVFDSPTEIDSLREGNFIESISPGAFKKTFAENRSNMKVLFQHGRDPQIGNKPIADIVTLHEDDRGAFYEASMFEGLDPLVESGLRAGVYGASFRFTVMREDVNRTPGESSTNPRGLPERTIREAQVAEFGPVTWGAYKGATAGVRSITDTILDVDALAYAGAIILDEERMNQARIFVSRDLPEPETDWDEERKDFSTDQRKTLAKSGKAMPDGSFPIVTVQDLQNAISAFGRAGNKAGVKAHIIKRAKALGRSDLIPDSWKGSSTNSEEPDGIVRDEPVISDEQDAPPDDAEASLPHLIRGRREQGSQYLNPRKEETPSWRLPSKTESHALPRSSSD